MALDSLFLGGFYYWLAGNEKTALYYWWLYRDCHKHFRCFIPEASISVLPRKAELMAVEPVKVLQKIGTGKVGRPRAMATVRSCVNTYLRTYVRTYIHKRIHACIRTHRHTYIPYSAGL